MRYLFRVLAILFFPALYIGLSDFSYVPGQQPESRFCSDDVGTELSRQGHSEELLWRGCLIASESGKYFSRFVTRRDLTKATPDGADLPSCLSCHDAKRAPAFAEMWVRFPRFNERTQSVEDFAQAIQAEIETRYEGVRPNRSDNAITALYFYAAAKAGQAGKTFQVEAPHNAPLTDPDIAKLAASPDCRTKFEQKGWPKGPNAGAVVKGCNLMTETQKHVRGPIARQWRTDLTCQSCHLDAGDKSHAGSIAHAAVVLPHMYTAVNQPIRFDRRVLLCFGNSLNWYDLGLDAQEITYINIYANWLAQKNRLVIGRLPEGRGMPLVYDAMGRGSSFLAGEHVYKAYCEPCHGKNGLGGAGPVFNGREPAPLAGPHSFSAAASTADPYRFAGFVYANMPYGATMEHPVLSVQQALDVSAYLTSLGRPADSTKVNQIQVLLNHIWLKIVVSLGDWMSSLGNRPEDQESK